MKMMKRLSMCAANNNFAVYNTYIPGGKNLTISDGQILQTKYNRQF